MVSVIPTNTRNLTLGMDIVREFADNVGVLPKGICI